MQKVLLLQLNFILLFICNLFLFLNPLPFLNALFFKKILNKNVSLGSYIHRGVRITSLRGDLYIGDKTSVGSGSVLDNRRNLYIGRNVSISRGCKFYTLQHNIFSPERETLGQSVVIEDNAELYSDCVILPGVTVGSNSIVACNSIVVKDVAKNSAVAGNPAKLIAENLPDKNCENFYPYIFGL